MVTPTNHVIARDLWHFGYFCNIFLPNVGENQKMSHHLSAGLLTLRNIMLNLAVIVKKHYRQTLFIANSNNTHTKKER